MEYKMSANKPLLHPERAADARQEYEDNPNKYIT